MRKVAPYDVAAAFRAAWRSAQARGDIARGGLVRATYEDELLIVQLVYMPEAAFDSRFLRDGPGAASPLFSPVGATYYERVSEIAVRIAQGADQNRGLAAVMLMPSAMDAARARLAVAA